MPDAGNRKAVTGRLAEALSCCYVCSVAPASIGIQVAPYAHMPMTGLHRMQCNCRCHITGCYAGAAAGDASMTEVGRAASSALLVALLIGVIEVLQ